MAGSGAGAGTYLLEDCPIQRLAELVDSLVFEATVKICFLLLQVTLFPSIT